MRSKMTMKRKLVVAVIFLIVFVSINLAYVEIFYSIPEILEEIKYSGATRQDVVLSFYGIPMSQDKLDRYYEFKGEEVQIDIWNNVVYIFGFILTPAALITSIISILIFGPIDRRTKKRLARQRQEEDRLLKKRYFEKYPTGDNSITVKCVDSKAYDLKLMNVQLIVWIEDDILNMINSDFRKDIGIYKVNINNIICFSRYGDLHTSTHIKGGGTSFKGAALGYLIAGDVGAIVASREKIKSETKIDDKRETFIIFTDKSNEKYLFFEPKLYDYLMRCIPNKEMTYAMSKIKNSENQSEDKYDKILKLAKMKENGYITNDEYEKLKREIIDEVS